MKINKSKLEAVQKLHSDNDESEFLFIDTMNLSVGTSIDTTFMTDLKKAFVAFNQLYDRSLCSTVKLVGHLAFYNRYCLSAFSVVPSECLVQVSVFSANVYEVNMCHSNCCTRT